MKKIYTLLFLLLPTLSFSQGMYVPSLLDSSVMADMNAKDCRFTKEDIYSFNHASMKDAVLIFGGGCTGEMISDKGLMVTNYHCGLSQVQRNSSVEHDYLTTGFWSKSGAEEIACPGLTVTFIVKIIDVTDSIMPQVNSISDDIKRQSKSDSISKKIIARAVKGTVYSAYVRPFYYGNQAFLFLTQTFKDVRLVGAPPYSIGNFGGDTDNWEWPRHTGDFSLFRIYADRDNGPADYSKDNVPYKPGYFFPISIKGINENDFTMVYGFPGNTEEYIPSYAVDLIQNVTDPDRIKVRTERLKIWEEAMRSNDTTRIQYQSKYNSLSNGWKKWMGEELGLKECNVIQKKKDFELSLSQNSIERGGKKSDLTPSAVLAMYKTAYDSLKLYQPVLDYTSEVLMAPEISRYVIGWKRTADYLKHDKNIVTDSMRKALRKNAEGFFKNYNHNIDEQVMRTIFPMYLQNVKNEWRPEYVKTALKKYNNNGVEFIRQLYANSFFDNKNDVLKLIDNLSNKSVKKIEKDPFYQYTLSAYSMNDSINETYNDVYWQIEKLNRTYMKLQMGAFPEKKFYPDANFTLRVAYGNVKSYAPRNGVTYKWYTTTDGILEKYYSASAPDYKIPTDYKDLLESKDFGEYADKGEMHTCFIASNHTTGGNSGSPVLDANGNLIGINFDRVWEGTMSDIYFDTNRCRNISLDARYFLFIVDKYAKADYLIKEMKIVR